MNSDALNEIRRELEEFMEYLYANGYELNEDGDIIDAKTKRLIYEPGGNDE